jgi:hypothetical protein
MIVFDLQCEESGDRFEAWFRSSADYEDQRERGLVQCPMCQSNRVAKAPMAPRVPKKGNTLNLGQLAAFQAELLKGSDWVGDRFAEEARAMHLGEIEQRPVHGNATAAEAKSLIEEGIPVAPLPLPITTPDQVN